MCVFVFVDVCVACKSKTSTRSGRMQQPPPALETLAAQGCRQDTDGYSRGPISAKAPSGRARQRRPEGPPRGCGFHGVRSAMAMSIGDERVRSSVSCQVRRVERNHRLVLRVVPHISHVSPTPMWDCPQIPHRTKSSQPKHFPSSLNDAPHSSQIMTIFLSTAFYFFRGRGYG